MYSLSNLYFAVFEVLTAMVMKSVATDKQSNIRTVQGGDLYSVRLEVSSVQES
jgi:hypothetical protein